MADKKIQMTQRNSTNDGWDNLYPKTTGYQVVAADGTTTFESHLADYLKHGIQGTTDATGTATAYTLTPNPALSAYNKGLPIEVFFDKANAGSSTINISGKGAITLKKQDGTTYASGELNINTPYRFVFNGTDFLADSSIGYYGTAGAAQTLSGYTLGTKTGVINGTMPNNGAINVTQTASGQVTNIPAGYTSGGQVTNNITIASLGGKRYATGGSVQATGTSGQTVVNNLPFTPSVIVGTLTDSNGNAYATCVNGALNFGSCSGTGPRFYNDNNSGFVIISTNGFTVKTLGNSYVTLSNWKAYE